MAAVGADCHFFYSSTCHKGSWCPFRHVDATRGHGVPCRLWSSGVCYKANCRFRHPPCRQVNPSQVPPCRWETQPGGCTKPYCAFRHSRRQGFGSETLPIAAENRAWKRSSDAAPPCRWETQPGRCTKPYCTFRHSRRRGVRFHPVQGMEEIRCHRVQQHPTQACGRERRRDHPCGEENGEYGAPFG
ncbi:hypothetical protein ACOMHN_020252 [Nucella lapillus]